MGNIGGNTSGMVLVNTSKSKNAIGEAVSEWVNAISEPQLGWLDLQNGDSKRTNFNAKIEESTHVFLCDYDADIYALRNKDTRMVLKGDVYDVLLIDNPMEMNEQLEIYLRRVGAWNGK